MPRYAKGSLEQAIYTDIKTIGKLPSEFLFLKQEDTDTTKTIQAVMGIVQTYRAGLVTDKNFLIVLKDILS
jgi:hypothetical protein